MTFIFIVNKWDKIEKSTSTMKEFKEEIRLQYKELDHFQFFLFPLQQNKS